MMSASAPVHQGVNCVDGGGGVPEARQVRPVLACAPQVKESGARRYQLFHDEFIKLLSAMGYIPVYQLMGTQFFAKAQETQYC